LKITPQGIFETYGKVAYPSLEYSEYSDAIHRVQLFLEDRLENLLKSQGHRSDTITAVFNADWQTGVGLSHFLWRERALDLEAFLSTKEGENLLAGYKRAANILKAEAKKGKLPDGAPIKPSETESAALYEALQITGPKIEKALGIEDYTAAMAHLAELRGPIDAFFTHVQVISDDSDVKDNNLRLLGLIRDTARQIADFEAISG
jgi:glycyl-tRNA synthetase beta chain